jgi:phosphoribosylanthranilate isomerase
LTTWVKVCGLRTIEDIEAAVEAGADALGLMLAPSPRRVSIEQAAGLVEAAGSTNTVIVMVDVSVPEVDRAVEATRATGLQVYGAHAQEVARWGKDQGLLVLQPFAIGSEAVSDVSAAPGAIPLFDTVLPDMYGGGGRTFDWKLVRGYARPFVLAGGLDPDNVGRAVRETGAWGVDASSGLESSRGTKDHSKVRAFIEGAKRHEA